MQTAAHTLKSSSLYSSMTAKSADTSVATASAVLTAVAGTYNVNVSALAKAQSLATKADFSTHTGDISTTDGKIKIELGRVSSGTFTADSTKTAINIDVKAGASSLDEIRDQINAANAGVRASVVYVGKNSGGTDVYKLALTSKDTGADNSMKISVMDSNGVDQTNNTGLAQLAYDPSKTAGAGNEYDVKTPAQDAQLTVDGVAITRGSNTITDAIGGVTLNLLKESSTSVTISKDTTAVTNALQAFVKAYNEVNSLAHKLSDYNSSTKTGAVLTGDSSVRSLQTALREMVGQSGADSSSSVRNLTAVGITMQRDGSLSFDTTKLTSAFNSSASDVAKFFAGDSSNSTKGVASKISSSLDAMLATGGLISSRTEGINTSIKNIDQQRDALNTRLTAIEKRYRAQFTALDSMVSSMQRTSTFLTQQLASITGISSSSK